VEQFASLLPQQMQVVASANHNEKQSLPALALSMLLGSHLSTFA
jgi:hypothetical protein